MINDACVLEKKAFCHAGVVAFEGQVMSWIPGDYPCYRCIFEDVPDDYIPNCSQAGVLGAMAGVIGSLQALEAIKYVTGIGEMLLGKMLHFDRMNMKTRIAKISKKSNFCMVCGNDSIIEDVKNHSEKYRINGCEI